MCDIQLLINVEFFKILIALLQVGEETQIINLHAFNFSFRKPCL